MSTYVIVSKRAFPVNLLFCGKVGVGKYSPQKQISWMEPRQSYVVTSLTKCLDDKGLKLEGRGGFVTRLSEGDLQK